VLLVRPCLGTVASAAKASIPSAKHPHGGVTNIHQTSHTGEQCAHRTQIYELAQPRGGGTYSQQSAYEPLRVLFVNCTPSSIVYI
jgi:hypothetical protein